MLICLRLLEQEPDRFERATVRWLGRLLRSSIVLRIGGESYRMRAHRAQAERLRAASRA